MNLNEKWMWKLFKVSWKKSERKNESETSSVRPIIGLILTDLPNYTIYPENATLRGLNFPTLVHWEGFWELSKNFHLHHSMSKLD